MQLANARAGIQQDRPVVVNRTIVYAGLTAASVVGYLAVVALAGRWLGVQGTAPVVAGAVVAVAAAARTRVQRWVDRRLFGSRGDPYEVVRSVGASTAAADAPDAALAALVATVHAALRVPFVQVLDSDGESVAEAGEPVAGTHVHPVVDRGRQLGVLVVGRRSPREKLRADEQSALHEVARRAGALLSSRQLSADLQRSYEQLFRVREEERRRLRRELHDGIGPALAGTALQLDSLAGRLREQPELAQRAERLRDRLQSTVSEVRRIVDGLRPAALDELGLPAALQAFATDADDPVEVAVSTDLPDRLPAGVEAAAYRIAGEAVANALRHGGGRRASVTARVVDDELHLDVVDDGTGFGTGATAGVGLQSMHDRAAEVGGTLVVDSAPGSGTTVRAVLPLQRR
jgi:signal transduction histidine kinase